MEKYLIHYGVKGMKWGKHVKATYDDVVKTSRDIGRAQTKTAGLNAHRGYFDKDNPGSVAGTLFRRVDGYHVDDDYNNQANAIYDANTKARINNSTAKKNYDMGLGAKAKTYEQQRANTSKKQSLDATKVNASRDIGRAQSKMAAANAQYQYITPGVDKYSTNVMYKSGTRIDPKYSEAMATAGNAMNAAKQKLSSVTSKIASYDDKTKTTVSKITSGKTSISQIGTAAADKAKTLVTKLFGKKGK